MQLNAAAPILSVNATSISFGSINLNTPSTQSVTLSSTGTQAVTVSGATVTGTGFSLTGATFPTTLNPGQSTTLSVQFDPTTAGSATGQLTITSNSSTSTSVLIALSGTGQTASHSVTLTWAAPSSSPVPVVGYNVYRAPGGSTSYQQLNSSEVTQTTYVDSTVQSGQTYDYYVESVDSSGVQSSPSNTTVATIP
ncbi:MAG: choice-of-anchor D domain-containing protein [Terracidiphilus sp.]